MSTIDSITTIQAIIKNDGYFEDDPRVYQIVQYTNAWGGITYGITWEHEPEYRRHRYENETGNVMNPQIIWRADDERYQANNW